MTILYYDETDSPVGPLTLWATDQGLCRLEFGSFADRSGFVAVWFAKKTGNRAEFVHDPSRLHAAVRQLQEYFAGNRNSFDLTYHFHGTPFQEKVWRALLDIPYGETRSYKQIAEAIGAPKAVRAVGGANNRNPVALFVPCHRVIGAGGAMVGYGGGLPIKRYLLELEANTDRMSG